MAVEREKPYPNTNFLVDLGTGDTDSARAGVIEVILPRACVQTLKYRNGNAKNDTAVELQTLTRYSNLILRRGFIGTLDWYDWWHTVRSGRQDSARTVIVKLLDEARTTEVVSWQFIRAVPVNYHYSSLNALEPETLLETLELTFQTMYVE